MKDGIIGSMGVGCSLLAFSLTQIETILSIISLIAITATTIGVQVYRLIRDRDKDLKSKNDESIYVDSSKNKQSED